MRKFSVRWWVTEGLITWRYQQACGEYDAGFATWPFLPNVDWKFRWAINDESFGMFSPFKCKVNVEIAHG